MEMPDHVKQTLQELEDIVKRINCECMEEAVRRTSPYIRHIASIKSMYPNSMFISQDQLMYLSHLQAQSAQD